MDGYKIVVTKSTVPVGTADAIKKIITGLTSHPVGVASNPEFLKEGAAISDFMKPDRVVIGSDDKRALEVLRQLYAPFVRASDRVHAMDARSAEMTKYASNALLAVRISFMNDLAMLAEKVGADIELVRRGVGADARIGPKFLFPGPGYGGSCFPKDVSALLHTGNAFGHDLELVRATQSVNARQKRVLGRKNYREVRRLPRRQNDRGLQGLAFKPQTDDVRESASTHADRGSFGCGCDRVQAHDPQSYAARTGRLRQTCAFERLDVRRCRRLRRPRARYRMARIPEPRLRKVETHYEPAVPVRWSEYVEPSRTSRAGLLLYGHCSSLSPHVEPIVSGWRCDLSFACDDFTDCAAMNRYAFVSLRLGAVAGIEAAVAGQANAAAAMGAPLDVIVVSEADAGLRNSVRFARSTLTGSRAQWFKARAIADAVDLDAYDVVFVRYPTAIDLDPLALLRGRRSRVVTIHHTKEIEETRSVGESMGVRMRAAMERVQGRRLLERVDGVIGVTDEIRRYEVERARRVMPSVTITNGIDVQMVPTTGFVPFDGEELHLAFIASADASWHGKDRILAGIDAYTGPVKLHLHVVAPTTERPGSIERRGSATVHHHGILRGSDLTRVYERSTVAVAGLAQSRRGLRVACTLKVREYVARGLPFVLGHQDADVNDDSPFVLRVADDETPLDMERVVDFCQKTAEIAPELVRQMREFAELRLDWSHRVRSMVGFAQQVSVSR